MTAVVRMTGTAVRTVRVKTKTETATAKNAPVQSIADQRLPDPARPTRPAVQAPRAKMTSAEAEALPDGFQP